MNAIVEKQEKNRVTLQVEVEADRVEKAMQQAYRRLANEVRVPGFRKGRVPRQVLERRIGKELILHEAVEVLFPSVYADAIDQTDIEPIDEAHLDYEADYTSGQPLKLKVDVEVMPEVTLKDYRGISVERSVVRVTEENVNDLLERMRQGQAELTAAEHQEVAEGDYVSIDYTGYVDDQPFEGGAAQGLLLQIGTDQFLPGFGEQLLGAAEGDEREVRATLDETFDGLAQREAVFRVVVNEIKVRRLPELDDDFAKDVSEFNTLADLRADLRGNLEQQAEERATAEMRETLLREVADRAEVEIPTVLVNRELERMLDGTAYELAMRGVDPRLWITADFVKRFQEDYRERAEGIVKLRLVLRAVADREGLAVAAEEVDARIEELVAQAGPTQADEIRKEYASESSRRLIKQELQRQKAMDFLVESAVIAEKVIDAPIAEAESSEEAAEADSEQ